jgi:acetoacetyl-CoA synthetase
MGMNTDKVMPLWTPGDPFIESTHLRKYQQWLKKYKGRSFRDYSELWQWSIDYPGEFWQTVWDYFQIKSHTPHKNTMSSDEMPFVTWFEGASVNYAEHIFRMYSDEYPAIIFQSERHSAREISWSEMKDKVSRIRSFLVDSGVKKGDRVVAFLPNIPEATYTFLATISLGAIWSSCSPDFGMHSVVDRFEQIKPSVLFAVDGYQYNGKPYNKLDVVTQVVDNIASLTTVVLIPYLNDDLSDHKVDKSISWAKVLEHKAAALEFETIPFEHPIWVLYSSGTTGRPKAITHTHGGVLLEHLKYLAFHNDVHVGEKFFWFSTTGWMMWNFVQASLLVGATIVLYDGSPGYPSLNVLWEMADQCKIQHFGTSAPYLVACMKAELNPSETLQLKHSWGHRCVYCFYRRKSVGACLCG